MFTSTRTPGGGQKGQREVGRALADQLLTTDSADDLMFEKEEEIRLLRMRLHEVEMELTKLKVE